MIRLCLESSAAVIAPQCKVLFMFQQKHKLKEREERKSYTQGHKATQNPKKRMNISFLTTCPMFFLLHHCTIPSARSSKNIIYLLAINIMQEHIITYIVIFPQEIKECCIPQIHEIQEKLELEPLNK